MRHSGFGASDAASTAVILPLPPHDAFVRRYLPRRPRRRGGRFICDSGRTLWVLGAVGLKNCCCDGGGCVVVVVATVVVAAHSAKAVEAPHPALPALSVGAPPPAAAAACARAATAAVAAAATATGGRHRRPRKLCPVVSVAGGGGLGWRSSAAGSTAGMCTHSCPCMPVVWLGPPAACHGGIVRLAQVVQLCAATSHHHHHPVRVRSDLKRS
jgi:hypothetical protein